MRPDIDRLVHEELLRYQTTRYLHDYQLFQYAPRRRLWTPMERVWELVEFPSFSMLEMVAAYENAELYRKAILDERFSVLDYKIFFGRAVMIHYLGLINYRKAIPELREIFLHAEDAELRCFALEPLERMNAKPVFLK